MQHHLLDADQKKDSLIHRLPATIKLPAAVIFVLTTVLLNRNAWPAFILSGAGLLITAILSRLNLFTLGKRILLLELFAAGIACMAFFQPNGFQIILSMLAKSTLCLSCMVILSQTTSFSEIVGALRRFHFPGLLLTTLTLAYRYLFVLMDEANRMGRARRSRTFNNSRRFTWRTLSETAAQLFIRSSERAERVYAAMTARGWKT